MTRIQKTIIDDEVPPTRHEIFHMTAHQKVGLLPELSSHQSV